MSSELDQLRAWVTARAHNLPATGLSDDLPLLANRHLTSLHLAELILFLERLRKVPIDVEVLQAGAFQDIATIASRFLSGSGREVSC